MFCDLVLLLLNGVLFTGFLSLLFAIEIQGSVTDFVQRGAFHELLFVAVIIVYSILQVKAPWVSDFIIKAEGKNGRNTYILPK